MVKRAFATHDLVHVLGGYGTDPAGELGALGFYHGQCDGWVTSAMAARVMTSIRSTLRRDGKLYWEQAVERGRDTPLLFMARFEDLLEQPLDDVRAELGIPPATRAHPEGHLSVLAST